MQDTFQPVYIFPWELASYGLPSPVAVPNINNLVQSASSAIDIWCMKVDSEGYGSLVYSTYNERIVLKSNSNPNVFRLTKRPLFGVSAATVASLEASGGAPQNQQGLYNGIQASTGIKLNGYNNELCAILSLSGRYARTRNDDPFGEVLPYMNLMNLSQVFGGPPQWFALDPTQTDYNSKTGEVWAPPGIYWYRFSEVEVTYTAGFNPLAMPPTIKQVCADIVRNMLTRPIAGAMSANFSDAAINMTFASTYVDPFSQARLAPFKNEVYA